MEIKELLKMSLEELTENEIIESEAINNLMAACGITSGNGSCGKNPVIKV